MMELKQGKQPGSHVACDERSGNNDGRAEQAGHTPEENVCLLNHSHPTSIRFTFLMFPNIFS